VSRLTATGRDPATGERTWELKLTRVEAAILRSLPGRLEQVLGDPNHNRAVIDRLFPQSYEDPEEERENRLLLGASLLAERREAMNLVRTRLEPTAKRKPIRLGDGELDQWLRFINDARLWLAVDLGIEENLDDVTRDWESEAGKMFALLEYLGAFEMQLVTALRDADSDEHRAGG
jgi:hypothetical protein